MRWLLLSISLDLRNLYLDGMDEHSGRVKLIESGIYESDLEVDDFFMLLLTISLLNVIMKV